VSRNPRYARQILRLVVIAAATFATLSTGARTPAPAATGQSIITLNSAAMSLNAPIVGVAATKSGNGYWRVAADGGVLTAGDAPFYGSAFGKAHAIVIGIAPTPTGKGYWLVDIAGSVYNFGDAAYRGQMWGKRLAKPVVGITGAPDGKGYWLVASDGGIFTFGSAQFYGSTGAIRLKQPVVGIASTPTGKGYWLVASDGGVFTFGNAGFFGSTGAMRLAKPVVGMAASPAGSGYTMVAADGGLFRFGSNMPFYGSAANACPGAPAVGVALSPAAVGYWITFANAMTYAFSPSTRPPTCGPSGTSILDKLAADLFKRVNDERAARNLPALGWDPALASYAKGWSANMAGNGFRHSNISTLLGPYNFVGENIAAGSPGVTAGGLHLAWMHSTGHRANIVSAAFTRVGIGAYCGPDGAIWLTEDFGRPTSAGATPPMNPNPPEYPIARPDPGTLHC
jgi:uncharacterized protein YkwD